LHIGIVIIFSSERCFPIAVATVAVVISSPVDKLDSVVEQEEQDVCVDLGERETRDEEGLAIREVETHMEDGYHS
jgi:hypothetical protein